MKSNITVQEKFGGHRHGCEIFISINGRLC